MAGRRDPAERAWSRTFTSKESQGKLGHKWSTG